MCVLFILKLKQLEIETSVSEQLLVRADFSDRALVQYQDLVHVLNGREAMRDGNRGSTRHQGGERISNQQLGFRIDARCGFVENEHARIERQRPREGKQLLLPDRQRGPAFGDGGAVPALDPIDELIGVHGARRAPYMLIVN